MDEGIIAVVKTRYRKMKYEISLDMTDMSFENIYNVDQLTAMRDVRTIWYSISADLIRNCRTHTNLTIGERVPAVETHEQDIFADVKEVVNSLLHSTQYARVKIYALACLLDPVEE